VTKAKVCILRAPGTNCDLETRFAVEQCGAKAEIIHINKFVSKEKDLLSYHGLIIPGGFSYGDHVRSGAIMGKILGERFGEEVEEFAKQNKPILGICNGFQVLIESGFLPAIENKREIQASLCKNDSNKFECRWVYLKVTNEKCIFTKGLSFVRFPVAHAEGKFITSEENLKKLRASKQVVFQYALEDQSLAERRYPFNPNGSLEDVAGVCNPEGTILGLMPHPERAFLRITYPDWSRAKSKDEFGEGYHIFKNMVDYIINEVL